MSDLCYGFPVLNRVFDRADLLERVMVMARARSTRQVVSSEVTETSQVENRLLLTGENQPDQTVDQ